MQEKCIDSLYDELLEMVFLMLPKWDRLNCKLVCHKWNNLLMTRAIFASDRHLYLSNCVINVEQPPASVIMRAPYPYQMLTIGENCEEDKPDQTNNWTKTASTFWKFLGQSTTHVSIETQITNVSPNVSFTSIAKAMPLVKSYKFTHESLTCFRPILRFMGHLRLFENVEEIICQPVHFNYCSYADIESLTQNMPKLKRIDAEPFGCQNQPLIPLHPMLNSIKFAPLYQFVEAFNGESVTENMSDFIKESHPTLKKLHYKAERPNYTFLATALKKNPNIKEVHLDCMEIPIFVCPEMTVLKLRIIQRHMKFEQLNFFQNLRSLELDIEYEGCSFSHVPLFLQKLETLKIKWTNCTCNKCYVALTSSFPNLKRLEFQVRNCKIPPMYIKKIIRNWPLLEHIKVKNYLPPMVHQKLSEVVRNLHVKRPYLRHFDLGYPVATTSDIIALHNVAPNIHTLNITYDSRKSSLNHVITAILPRFKNVTNLHIYSIYGNLYFETSTLNHILFHGHRLRALTLPDINDVIRKTILDYLFENLPQLNSFSSFTPQPICAASNMYMTRQDHFHTINCVLQLSHQMHHQRHPRYRDYWI